MRKENVQEEWMLRSFSGLNTIAAAAIALASDCFRQSVIRTVGEIVAVDDQQWPGDRPSHRPALAAGALTLRNVTE